MFIAHCDTISLFGYLSVTNHSLFIKGVGGGKIHIETLSVVLDCGHPLLSMYFTYPLHLVLEIV